MPNNQMDYSLVHRTPDGNGKILVTTPGSPDKGSWESEAELKTYVNQDVVMKTDIVQSLGQQLDKVPSNKAVDDAINAINTRVTNIEETLMGENEITVQYPDDGNYSSLMPNKVPLRALKFAEVPTFRGKSRAWNQLAKAINATNWQFGGSTGSFADGVASFTASGQYGCVRLFGDARFNLVANHYYLMSAEIKTTTAITSVRLALNWNSGVGEVSVAVTPSTSWQTVSFIVPFGATGYNDGYIQVFDARTGSWDAIQVRNVICHDLTLIFPEGVPSTIAECVQKCPDILKYNAYDAGPLVDTVVSGAESRDSNDNILDTLALSTPVTLRSARDVSEVLSLETGKKTRPIGRVDLSTLAWGESGGIYYATLADMASDAEGVCSNYVVTHKNAPDLADGEMNCGYNAGYLQIKTSSSPTGILNYELATPLSDEQVCDPVPDNFLEVQGGGTVETIQTQTPVIDNCLDVTYDIIPQ